MGAHIDFISFLSWRVKLVWSNDKSHFLEWYWRVQATKAAIARVLHTCSISYLPFGLIASQLLLHILRTPPREHSQALITLFSPLASQEQSRRPRRTPTRCFLQRNPHATWHWFHLWQCWSISERLASTEHCRFVNYAELHLVTTSLTGMRRSLWETLLGSASAEASWFLFLLAICAFGCEQRSSVNVKSISFLRLANSYESSDWAVFHVH